MGWRRAVSVGPFLADSDGGDFRVTTNLTGWYGNTNIKGAVTDRAQQDGGLDGSGLSGPRLISLTGRVEQSSRSAALAVADEISALTPHESYEFIVDEPATGPRSATVRLTGLGDLEWASPSGFTYSMQLTAPDMLKYGPAWFGTATLASTAAGAGRLWPRVWPRDWGVPAGVTPGAISVPNAGTAPYWTKIRIDGPVTNPVIRAQETGDSIRLIQPDGEDVTITSGQWFDLDTGQRHVTFGANANDVRYLADVSGAWLAVPPGGVTLTFEADAGTSETTLTVFGYEGAWS